jgi:hypothetical protein
MGNRLKWILAIGFLTHSAAFLDAASPEATEIAARIDQTLSKELGIQSSVPRSTDATFVRRIFLDLIGQPPTPEDALAFAFDTSRDKRAALVETLLGDRAFGENWARYWRDVVMYRRTEPRAAQAAVPLQRYLAEQLNENTGWDKIATEFMTATGDVREHGDAALIMAQGGKPEDVVAEISRIFLGIQIQCAQCHDHPTDRWERQQFHQLAAFFPRVAVRPKRDADKRSFEVVVNDGGRRRRRRTNNNNRFVGTLEHSMPNLDDPSSEGTKMQPVFFLTGGELPIGTADAERRGTLAEWITATDNPWFAKAFVNRVWAELIGEGLCEPVDDLGPDRECNTPETFDLLAGAFAESGYDIKWLYRTIAATEAYQRDSRTRREVDADPFQANCPQRLRGDQLYDALVAALGIPERALRGNRQQAGDYRPEDRRRVAFNQAFGFDPSEPRAEVKSSIQQALAVMNSSFLTRSINARRNGRLAQMLRTHRDDRTALSELYLHTLSRAPSNEELRTCLDYIRRLDNRNEAFEDLQWALVNSTEFLYRK